MDDKFYFTCTWLKCSVCDITYHWSNRSVTRSTWITWRNHCRSLSRYRVAASGTRTLIWDQKAQGNTLPFKMDNVRRDLGVICHSSQLESATFCKWSLENVLKNSRAKFWSDLLPTRSRRSTPPQKWQWSNKDFEVVIFESWTPPIKIEIYAPRPIMLTSVKEMILFLVKFGWPRPHYHPLLFKGILSMSNIREWTPPFVSNVIEI